MDLKEKQKEFKNMLYMYKVDQKVKECNKDIFEYNITHRDINSKSTPVIRIPKS